VQGRFADRAARDLVQTERLGRAREAPAISLDGERVHLAANVELLEEVPISVELGADGIGLFRTEFLYHGTEHPAHRGGAVPARAGRLAGHGWPWRVLSHLGPGRDKLPTSVRIPAGTIPRWACARFAIPCGGAMSSGCQLRAFYRAAAVGPLRIMFPLISGVAELRTVRELCAGVCAELQRDGLEYNPEVPLGVMVETPSAAVIADLLVDEVRLPFPSVPTT